MAFSFHHDKPRYFQIQYQNAKDHVVPFIQKLGIQKHGHSHFALGKGMKVLEIGCAEGGVLKAFTDLGCHCTGVELSPSKIENAKLFMQEELANGRIEFICKNVYDWDFAQQYQDGFDLIVLKDTIEHIHDQPKLLKAMKSLLKPNGKIFFGFPPWWMPWGGHQQICKSKILSHLPWFHLLPASLYAFVLKTMGESEAKIADLLEIKETGINTGTFETMLNQTGYQIFDRAVYVINPIYTYKFGIKPWKQAKWFQHIPYLRDLCSTTVFYLVG